MSILRKLQEAMHEAEENGVLVDKFQIDSDIKFAGKLQYTGGSAIELGLVFEVPVQSKTYTTEQLFNQISEEQFKEASAKIQEALEKTAKEFKQSLKNKLASYGLKEGEIEDEQQRTRNA